MPMFPNDYIKSLLDNLDIVDIIGSRINLQKKGNNYSCCCPFHQEKTPSFVVNPDKQFFHCFGCAKSGDAIQFITEHDGLSFPETIKQLSSQLGMPIPEENNKSSYSDYNSKILMALTYASETYYHNLTKNENKHVIEYLKKRGITGSTAKKFSIGYAENEWSKLANHLQNKNFSDNVIIDAGLATNKKINLIDKFKNRIMFPIKNKEGKVIGFGGRAISEDNLPKYLNTSETAVFSKGKELFGLYEAKSSIRKNNQALIVEGYFDVVMMHQNNITNAVAALGTSFTQQHLELVFRYTKEIIFCFDGDSAGIKAGIRALKLCLPVLEPQHSIKFLVLGDNEDPDSFLQNNSSDDFIDEINNALPLFEYIEYAFKKTYRTNISSIEEKLKFFNFAQEMISSITNDVIKKLMTKEINNYLDLNNKEPITKKFIPNRYSKIIDITKDKPLSYQHKLIALTLFCPELIKNDNNFKIILELIELNPGDDTFIMNSSKYIEEIKRIYESSESEESKIQLPNNIVSQLNLPKMKNYITLLPENGKQLEFDGCVHIIKKNSFQKKIDKLLRSSQGKELNEKERIILRKLIDQQLAID